MVSFMADVIGIRDDMYIGKGNSYMREVSAAVQQGYEAGILEQRPTLVNLQCDMIIRPSPWQMRSISSSILVESRILKAKKLPCPGPIHPPTANHYQFPRELSA